MCCSSASNVGGRCSRLLDFRVKRCFLASLTSGMSLVQSYIKTTKCCKVEIVAMFSCMCSKSSYAAVTSGKTFHVFHAVVLPLPANDDVVSHPVNAWNMCRVAQTLGSFVATLWTVIYWKLDPVPNAIHNSSGPTLLSPLPQYL